MADARTLLRQQRAARQQAQKPQKQSPAPAAAPTAKKRKAPDQGGEEKKRTRTEEEAGVPAGFFDAGATDDNDNDNDQVAPALVEESPTVADIQPPKPPAPVDPPLDAAAQAELDAFMTEMSTHDSCPARCSSTRRTE